jgi:ATP-dependent phosphoenolpyruvate carboxykinase
MKIEKNEIHKIAWYVQAQSRKTSLIKRTIFLTLEDAYKVYPEIKELDLENKEIYTDMFLSGYNNACSSGEYGLIIIPVSLYKD